MRHHHHHRYGDDADVDGVTFVRVGLSPVASKPSSSNSGNATVALYAGMTAAELQSVLRAALKLPKTASCAGFVVPLPSANTGHSHSNGAPKRHAKQPTGRERVVPLAVACVSPEVLHSPTGYVRVLLAAPPSLVGPSTAAVASARVQRLVEALRDEEKSLSSFESAILMEICEQRAEEVLQAMQSRHGSLESKKKYLLSLVRGGQDGVDGNTTNGTKASAATTGISSSSSAAGGGGGDANIVAQVDLICKKVVAIAHTVFSPHVQSDLMTEASLYREKQRKQQHQQHKRGDGGASSSSTSVSHIVELLGVVEKLLNKHALQEEQSVKLIRLILGENRLLLSALQSYKTDYNLNELENTIKRMAALSTTPTAGGGATGGATRGAVTLGSSPTRKDIPLDAMRPVSRRSFDGGRSSPAKKAKRKDRQGFIVRPHDILHTLYQKSMITTLEMDLLRALVNQNDLQVFAAVGEYENTRNLGTLRDQLVSIVEEITVELGDEEKRSTHHMGGHGHSQSQRQAAEDGDDEDDGDDDEENGVAIHDHWQESLIQFVQRMFSLRKLHADHVHVVRALIEDDHNLLQSAFEVFVSDGDANELLDTLQRIAKLQLQANEGALISAFNQVVDHHCDVLRATEKALVKQLFARKNELARAAWEVLEVEKNLDDFGDTLLRIARFATRQDTKLKLVEVVGEMMKRQLILSHEADGLIRLYEEKNDAMVGANEAFESDGDVKELVETLLLIVKHANFGDPPKCSSPQNRRHSQTLPLTPPSSPTPEYSTSQAETFFAARLIEILGSKGRLASWQMELLLELLAKRDDRVLATMDVYNEERDARELVDTLWRLCDLTAWDANKAKITSQWIQPLEKQHHAIIPKGVLQELVNKRDDRVVAAFVVFLGDNNSDEFADTLVRVARLEGMKKNKHQQQPHEDEQDDDIVAMKEELHGFLPKSCQVVGGSGSAGGLLSSEQVAEIEARLTAHDAATLAAFDVYRESHDCQDFVDTLQRILSCGSSGVTATPRGLVMHKQLLHFASDLGKILLPQQLHVLKLAIARNDSAIEEAVHEYQAQHDEDELKDSLKRIAIHLAAASNDL